MQGIREKVEEMRFERKDHFLRVWPTAVVDKVGLMLTAKASHDHTVED